MPALSFLTSCLSAFRDVTFLTFRHEQRQDDGARNQYLGSAWLLWGSATLCLVLVARWWQPNEKNRTRSSRRDAVSFSAHQRRTSFSGPRNRSRSDSLSLDGLEGIMGSRNGGNGNGSTSLSLFHPPPRQRMFSTSRRPTASWFQHVPFSSHGGGGGNSRHPTTSPTTSLDLIRTTDLVEAESLLQQIWELDLHVDDSGDKAADRPRLATHGLPAAGVTQNTSTPRRHGALSSYFRWRGPAVDTITFRTITPPSWEAHERTLWSTSNSNSGTESEWDLSRIVSLHVSPPSSTVSIPLGTTALLSIRAATTGPRARARGEPIAADTRPVTEVSLQVQPPPEGGSLEIYTKAPVDPSSHKSSATPSWTMEHTFASTAAAAQFQVDLMALQVFGPIIHAMYEALSLLHQGSLAHVDSGTTTEPVLHGYQPVGTTSTTAVGDDSATSAPASAKVEDEPVVDAVNNTVNTGVAWDDVMRCLGSSFPSVRIRLEVMWWLEVHGSWVTDAASHKKRSRANSSDSGAPANDVNGPTSVNGTRRPPTSCLSLAPLYTNKRRLLLGPVDFFRLFVPKLPPTAVPESECARYRMEHMLRWRKRVARACILVQWYTRARTVVNRGWSLGREVRVPDSYWTRRMAFDENLDNTQHDATTKNEYYEATVSRDVVCHVRGGLSSRRGSWWHDGSVEAPTAISLYQAYALVGMHAFQWSGDVNDSMLHYTKDPVRALPSLRALLEENPELDFFVFVFFPSALEAAIVQVYVRSLPKGVDPKFDRVVRFASRTNCVARWRRGPYLAPSFVVQIQRFVEGDKNVRRRKLEVVTQLGIDAEGLSFLGRFLLWWFSLLLRATLRKKNGHVPQPKSLNDRTSVPALNVSDCGASYHFGGRLQTDCGLPKNYVASTVHMESRRNNNFVTRMMLSYFECGGLSKYATDFTFIIAGDESDELPERALCSSRIVRSAINAIPYQNGKSSISDVKGGSSRRPLHRVESLYWKIFIADPLIVAFESATKWLYSFLGSKNGRSLNLQYNTSMDETSHGESIRGEITCIDRTVKQPLQKAVNEVVRILEGVTIPVRTTNMGVALTEQTSFAHNSEFDYAPILQRLTRFDIERYFVASNCCFRTASVRLVESTAWRERVFPIDTRSCRVELQNGQFFQQGKDYDGNPIFYFRNMCLGPWRKDNDAVIAAVLHRLESRLKELALADPNVQCTLIVLAGRPYQRKKNDQKSIPGDPKISDLNEKPDSNEQSTAASTFPDGNEDESVDEASLDAQNDALDEAIKSAPMNNPRIYRDELWNVHTTKAGIEQLVNILLAHYPERLSKALVVVGYGNKKYIRSALSGILTIASLVPSRSTRDKLRFLTKYRDLQTYADKSQLVTLVGGTQPVESQHFECR